MALKLMYITNSQQVARIAEAAGVDRIFVDMEYIGKGLRQGGMDTVQSHHTFDDVQSISSVLSSAELLVRINPIHEATAEYGSSREEIDRAIQNGADILMLPYFKTVDEVREFVDLVGGRAKTMPLIETPQAAALIEDIVKIDGIDELFIGLNDLSLGYGKKFMFEILADGTVDRLADVIKSKGIPFGFGGLAALDGGLLPGYMVLKEHYRLGSDSVILSRSFCNSNKCVNIEEISDTFFKGIEEIRQYEKTLLGVTDFEENRECVCQAIKRIVEG
ncbi:MAG: aldolase [Clostridia bacterium]|nr:aldolase [Clostridia bacterium]